MLVTSNLGGASPFCATDCRADVSESPKRPKIMLDELIRLRAVLTAGVPSHLAEHLERSFGVRDAMAQLEANAAIDMLVGTDAQVAEFNSELLSLRVQAVMTSDAEVHLAKSMEERRQAEETNANAQRTLRIPRDER